MKRVIAIAVMVVALFGFSVPTFASVVPDAIWANGTLYGTVVTPTSLPDQGPFEPIYNFANSGLAGQHSIAPAGPGEPGFYGGRWAVFFAYYTPSGLAHFNDGAGNVNHQMTSWQELSAAVDAGYVTLSQTDVRFVCTLVPGK